MCVCTLCFLAWRCLGLRLRGVKAVKPRFFFFFLYVSLSGFSTVEHLLHPVYKKKKEKVLPCEKDEATLEIKLVFLRERESERGREKLKKQ